MAGKTFIQLIYLAQILLLCGCGGGNSSSKSPETPNMPPTISGVSDQSIYEREALSFKPVITDSDGVITNINWEQISGVEVESYDSNSDTLSFISPNVDSNQTIVFKLIATDNSKETVSTELSINIQAYEAILLNDFSDVNFYECIKVIPNIDLGFKELTCDNFLIQSLKDVGKFELIESLVITNAGLSDITGLTNNTSLRRLDLSNNKINSIETINTNISLQEINLSNNSISELGGAFQGLETLTHLNLSNMYSVTNLKAFIDLRTIENNLGLLELNLSNNTPTNYSSFKKLKLLKSLKLSNLGNGFNSLSYFSDMTNLELLDISNNRDIYDVSALGVFKRLTQLNISDTSVTDVTVLKKLTALIDLNISNIGFGGVDMSFIKDLINIEVLNISENALIDVINVKNASHLKYLNAKNIRITDLSFVEGLTELEFLDVSYTNLRDISVVGSLTSLKELYLYHCLSLNDITPLTKAISLVSLDISHIKNNSDILDLTPLKTLVNLESFKTSGNRLTNLNVVDNFESLITLHSDLDVSDSALNISFSKLTQLKELTINGANRLLNIDSLTGAQSLEKLTLDGNRFIQDISPLLKLTNLKYLSIRNLDTIEDISSLSNLLELEYLNLSNTDRLKDISSLSQMKKLKVLNLEYTSMLINYDVIFGLPDLEELILYGNYHLPCSLFEELVTQLSNTDVRHYSDCIN